MNYYIGKDYRGNYDLCHYGVIGMEWGKRKVDPNANEEDNKNSDIDSQIANATNVYRDAATNLQMIARNSLSQGISLGANIEYLAARKALIKAKYELDQLVLSKKVEEASTPVTYSEQKKKINRIARETRKEELSKVSNNNVTLVTTPASKKQEEEFIPKNAADMAELRRNAAKSKRWRR